MKKLFIALFVVLLTVVAGLSTHDEPGQQIDEWAKQTAILFQDSINFFASLKSTLPTERETLDEIEQIDDAMESLLPGNHLNLQYNDTATSNIDISSSEPNISPEALLPNLFVPKQKSGTSVKGEIFTDEEDKIIGGKVQVAIPTDM